MRNINTNNLPGFMSNEDLNCLNKIKEKNNKTKSTNRIKVTHPDDYLDTVRLPSFTDEKELNSLLGFLKNQENKGQLISKNEESSTTNIPIHKAVIPIQTNELIEKQINAITKNKKKNYSTYAASIELRSKFKFKNIDTTLYYYSKSHGHYLELNDTNMDEFARRELPEDFKHHINNHNYPKEIKRWLLSEREFLVDEDSLLKRTKFICFTNCVVNIDTLEVLEHNKKYHFTSALQTKYPINGDFRGRHFIKFLKQITGGDQTLIDRLQELVGYIFSNIRGLKIIPFFLGPKDSGKSLVLKLLTHIIGNEYCSHLSFDQFNKQEFLADLKGKKLNTCGEVSVISEKQVEIAKKITGGDYVTARKLYYDSFDFTNTAVLAFAGNQLPHVKGVDQFNAFSSRLLIFPFNFPVSRDEIDVNLDKKLLDESEFIAYWAVIGINRLKNNNFQFTTNKEIELLEQQYAGKTNTIKSFMDECCVFDQDYKIHNEDFYHAYQDYCNEIGAAPESKNKFHDHFKSMRSLKNSRFRINGENKFGYTGVTVQDYL